MNLKEKLNSVVSLADATKNIQIFCDVTTHRYVVTVVWQGKCNEHVLHSNITLND